LLLDFVLVSSVSFRCQLLAKEVDKDEDNSNKQGQILAVVDLQAMCLHHKVATGSKEAATRDKEPFPLLRGLLVLDHLLNSSSSFEYRILTAQGHPTSITTILQL